jgi:hypothetical protein
LAGALGWTLLAQRVDNLTGSIFKSEVSDTSIVYPLDCDCIKITGDMAIRLLLRIVDHATI